MRTLIEKYPNHPGQHCGSVAMRSLIEHYCGLALPEDLVFGLGAGLDCVYLAIPGSSPSAMNFGRTVSMETDLAACLGLAYEEQRDPDDAHAWQAVRKEVLAGRPTMLSGDIFYLDYREYKVHFPGHRFVLLGFDDEKQEAYIADRINVAPETCSYGALFRSRNPDTPMTTQNLWGRFSSGEVEHDLTEAARRAIDLCTGRMLGTLERPPSDFAADAENASTGAGETHTAEAEAGDAFVSAGLAGLERLARELPSWREHDDVEFLASYNASAIEKFGNGGGNFRRLYAGFLNRARERDPARVPADAAERCTRAADRWTALAHALWATADDPKQWEQAAAHARALVAIERSLFEGLAEAAA